MIKKIPKTKKIIISVHDVSPKFKEEIRLIFNYLNKMKINKKEAFIVINWMRDSPIQDDKKLIQELKKEFLPNQINFHGITHYSSKQNLFDRLLFGRAHGYSGEFKEKSSQELNKYMKSGLTSFKSIFKKNPLGFIPSRWENSIELLKICKKLGIKYSEDSLHLINLETNAKKISPVLCFDYGDNRIFNYLSRSYGYIAIFIAWLFNLPLRFSIHPNDVTNGNIQFEMNLLKKLIDNKWQPLTTKEFWETEEKLV